MDFRQQLLQIRQVEGLEQSPHIRAEVRQKAGDQNRAQADLTAGMRVAPVKNSDWIARGLARMASDPKAALVDFEAVLKSDPRNREALQNKAAVALANRCLRLRRLIALLLSAEGRSDL